MELIYKNGYGACYRIYGAPNPDCVLQMVIDAVGIFMSMDDLNHLLSIVKQPPKPCNCDECRGKGCNKIWCHGTLVDFYLKVPPKVLGLLEDLIQGTLFILDMDRTLEKHRIK